MKPLKSAVAIDLSMILHQLVFSAGSYMGVNTKEPKDEDKSMFRHIYIYTIISYLERFKCNKEKPLFLAIDSAWPKPYWRKTFIDKIITRYYKDFYKPGEEIEASKLRYKANRGSKSEDKKIDWKVFYGIVDEINELFKTSTDISVLKVDSIEADDILYNMHKFTDDLTVVSSDGDLYQIPNVKLFNPVKKIFINQSRIDEFDIDVKSLTGDKKDNILAIRPKVGPATAKKIIKEGLTDYLDNNPQYKFRYYVNKKVLDLSKIPRFLKKKIIKEILTNIHSFNYNQMELMLYCQKHKLHKLLGKIGKLRLNTPVKQINKIKNNETSFSLFDL